MAKRKKFKDRRKVETEQLVEVIEEQVEVIEEYGKKRVEFPCGCVGREEPHDVRFFCCPQHMYKNAEGVWVYDPDTLRQMAAEVRRLIHEQKHSNHTASQKDRKPGSDRGVKKACAGRACHTARK